MATLLIQLPNLPPVFHALKDETATVGRMKGNTIVINDESVSLYHAKITRKDSVFYLKDLNSTNGTVVNGQPVSEVRLSDHDRVCFADVGGQFLLEEAAMVPAAMPITITKGPSAPLPSSLPPPRRPRGPSLRKTLAIFIRFAPGIAAAAVVGYLGWRMANANYDRSQVKALGRSITVSNAPAATPTRKPTVAELARALKSKDPAERRRAATALHALGDGAEAATPGLREALKDDDKEVRIWSALTLIHNKDYDQATVPILLEGLRHDNAALREVACLSLAVIPYYAQPDRESVIPTLAQVADRDVDADVRRAAMSALKLVAPEVFAGTNSE